MNIRLQSNKIIIRSIVDVDTLAIGREMKKSDKRIIIMVQTDYYPLLKMNASHKRFHFLSKGLSENENVLIICPNNKLKLETSKIDKIEILRIPAINLNLLKRPLFRIIGKYYLEKYLQDRGVTKDFVYWYNSVNAPVLNPKFKCLRIWDVMGIVSKEILRDKRSILNICKSAVYLKLEKATMKNTDIISTINESHKMLLSTNFNGPIEVIRDAIDDRELDKINNDTYTEIKNRFKNRFIILFVGSFDRRRIDDLLAVVPALKHIISNMIVLIVGEGPYLDYYKNITKSTGVDESVAYLGYMGKDDLNAIIKLSDICFADVFLEGFPYKIFEYALFEKPIVVKDTSSIREVLSNNRNTCLYQDKNELLQSIQNLYLNSTNRINIGKNAKQEILTNHQWNKRIKQIQNISEEYFNGLK